MNNPFPYEALYHRYADSWRVPAEESLLSACGGEVERGIPSGPFYAKDLEPAVREKAQAVCATAGVKPGPLFDACTLDVAVIGNDAAAKVYVNATPPVAVGTIVGGAPGPGGGPGPLGIPWWLWIIIIIIIIVVIIIIVIRRRR